MRRPTGRPTGRPTKLTTHRAAHVCATIIAGNFLEVACQFAGIHKDTLYAWLEKGAGEIDREGRAYRNFYDHIWKLVELRQALADSPDILATRLAAAGQRRARHRADYAAFSDAISKALAMCEVMLSSRHTELAMAGDAKALQWKLARMSHANWGDRARLDLGGLGESGEIDMSLNIRNPLPEFD